MQYRVADLNLELQEVGDMPVRMVRYETSAMHNDLVIRDTDLNLARWPGAIDVNTAYYMETGRVFYNRLLQFDGMMLHASAVVMDGYAYLFSGPCGMGKSTHAGLYLQSFGDRVRIINDDKPALRRIEGIWYAYGTPWCGKDGININERARLGGICFLRRGDTRIKRLRPEETIAYFIAQTQRYIDPEQMKLLLSVIDKLAMEVPVFECYNHADETDAFLTHSVMKAAIEEESYETESGVCTL